MGPAKPKSNVDDEALSKIVEAQTANQSQLISVPSLQPNIQTVRGALKRAHLGNCYTGLSGAWCRPVQVLSTGIIAVDRILGIGGLPRGRIVELSGPEGSGKTTVALRAIAHAQACGLQAAFIDAEFSLNASWAEQIGVLAEHVLFSRPEDGEEALSIAMALASAAVALIVVDSVPALNCRSDGTTDVTAPATNTAHLLARALPKLLPVLAKNQSCLVLTNQVRQKVDVMFGSPEATPGGNALKHYSSMRIGTRRIAAVKSGDEVQGSRLRLSILKSKLNAFGQQAEVDLVNEGLPFGMDLVQNATGIGLVHREGDLYRHDGIELGRSPAEICLWLKDHPEAFHDLWCQVRNALSLPADPGQKPDKTGKPPDCPATQSAHI